MRSSRLLCYRGRVPLPPSSQSGVSSTSKRLAATPDNDSADDVPRCSCRRCDSAESLARNLKDARLSSTRPSVSSSAKPKATQMGPTRPITTRMGPTRPEMTQGSTPRPGPSKRRSGDSPQRFSDYSSRQGSRTSPHKSRQGSDSPPCKRRSGDSPQRFSDYSSRQGTLLRVSRTTRLARGLSSEFLGLLVFARGLSSEFLGRLVSPGESYPTPEE